MAYDPLLAFYEVFRRPNKASDRPSLLVYGRRSARIGSIVRVCFERGDGGRGSGRDGGACGLTQES